MKKLFLVATLSLASLFAKSQSQVDIVSDISGAGKPNCSYTYDLSITFTLVDPSTCLSPVTVTVYPPLVPPYNFGGSSYSNTGLGYSGYVIVSATINTIIGSFSVGDYMPPLPCSLSPFKQLNTIFTTPGGCQYGAQWVYGSVSPTGTASLYLN